MTGFEKLEGKSILLSGGAGFIGSWLCETLLDIGASVICIDNFSTGNWSNIRHLKSNPNFIVTLYNVNDPKIVDDFEIAGFDVVMHFASPASPIDFAKIPIEIFKTNTVGTMNMLEIARRSDARFIFSSSSEIYGDVPPEHLPVKEEYRGNCNIIGIRSCFSDDTEILTENGWKLFQNLKPSEKVLTLGKNKNVEYQVPTEIIKQRYNGELIGFKNYHCDLLVTPNHKMYVSKRNDGKDKTFSLIRANESFNWDRSYMLKVANYDNDDEEWFYFPKDLDTRNSKVKIVEKIKMDDWLEFFGYYITEGCVCIAKKKKLVNNKEYETHDYRILIAQDEKKNRKKCEKIRKCLERLPFNFGYYGHQFYIVSKQLANYLKRFGKAKEKYIPRELMNVSKRQLEILFKAMILGDGSIKDAYIGKDGYERKEKTKYCSISYRLMSDFQEILLKIGCAGNILVHDRRNINPIYRIHVINKTGFETPTYNERYMEKYNGFVYCANVPNHVIFVRRNGKALFCGNCYDEGKRGGEAACMAYKREYEMDVRLCRVFNCYGKHMPRDGRAIPHFIERALEDKYLPIFGGGSQTRAFLYIEDLIDGILLQTLADNISGLPINIGADKETTVLNLAEKIIDISDSQSEIKFFPAPEDDPKRRLPDITRARELLKWKPVISLDEGLRRTIDDLK